MFDVGIVGAGPAGLSAALVLGRCRRSVLVCDDGHPRNYPSTALHGFLTRDGIDPMEFREIGRKEMRRYDTVELRDVRVTSAARGDRSFALELADGAKLQCRKLLIATGIVDELPNIVNIEDFYGRSVFHCPYCDGWEWRDQAIAVYVSIELALELTQWSRDLVLCTDGSIQLSPDDRRRLARNGISIDEERIATLEGFDGMLQAIVLASGRRLPRQAMFFSTGARQGADLAQRLGCDFDASGGVLTGSVYGLFVAGDASRDILLALVAAGQGAEAATAINTELLTEDLR
jgi:thioredoxin reductase